MGFFMRRVSQKENFLHTSLFPGISHYFVLCVASLFHMQVEAGNTRSERDN